MRAIFGLLFALATYGQNAPGFVHGEVIVPWLRAVNPGVKVAVESDTFRCETISGFDGKFNCQLPPGEYRVTAKSFDILNFQRAPITVRSRDHVRIVIPEVPAPERGITVTENGIIDYVGKPEPIQHFEEKAADSSPVLIRYLQMEQTDESTRFFGRYLMFTQEALTVLADELTCNRPLTTCRATGAVEVYVDGERLEGLAVDLDIKARSFTLIRPSTVTRTF